MNTRYFSWDQSKNNKFVCLGLSQTYSRSFNTSKLCYVVRVGKTNFTLQLTPENKREAESKQFNSIKGGVQTRSTCSFQHCLSKLHGIFGPTCPKSWIKNLANTTIFYRPSVVALTGFYCTSNFYLKRRLWYEVTTRCPCKMEKLWLDAQD